MSGQNETRPNATSVDCVTSYVFEAICLTAKKSVNGDILSGVCSGFGHNDRQDAVLQAGFDWSTLTGKEKVP